MDLHRCKLSLAFIAAAYQLQGLVRDGARRAADRVVRRADRGQMQSASAGFAGRADSPERPNPALALQAPWLVTSTAWGSGSVWARQSRRPMRALRPSQGLWKHTLPPIACAALPLSRLTTICFDGEWQVATGRVQYTVLRSHRSEHGCLECHGGSPMHRVLRLHTILLGQTFHSDCPCSCWVSHGWRSRPRLCDFPSGLMATGAAEVLNGSKAMWRPLLPCSLHFKGLV